MDSTGDIFVSLPLMGHVGLSYHSPSRWLVAVGDVSGKGNAASRLKNLIEAEITRLADTMSDPASILESLNGDPVDPDRFATL
jgi:hypothetical protein